MTVEPDHRSTPVVPATTDPLAAAHELAARLSVDAHERDAEGHTPADVYADLGASGLLDLGPGRADGRVIAASTILHAARVVAAADPNVAQILQNHYAALGSLWFLDFDPVVRDEIRAAVGRGAVLATAAAERSTASSLEVSTRIRREGDRYRLDGTKYYCTGSAGAAWFFVTALDESGERLRAIVPRADPGVAVLDDWDAIGQRATASGSVVFDGVDVEPGRVAPYVTSVDRGVFSATVIGIHTAIEVGIARGALEETRAVLLRTARPWPDAGVGRAAQDPLVLRRVGALVGRVHAVEALFDRAVGLVDLVAADRSRLTEARVALAETRAIASRTALDVSSELFAVAGAAAARSGLGLDRHWRNARTHSLQVPADWVDAHVGNHFLNGAELPSHGRI